MSTERSLPGKPRRASELRVGDFWSIPLSDGRFACGRVLGFPAPGKPRATVMCIGALLDWVGTAPPSAESVADAAVLECAYIDVSSLSHNGCELVGNSALWREPSPAQQEPASYWGETYAQQRAEFVFVAGNPPPLWERREVRSPLTEDMLQPFTSPSRVVQFHSRLTDTDFATLADFLDGQVNVTLRAYGSYDGSIKDLEFLRFFPTLKRFSADALYDSLRSLDGLRHLRSDVESLVLGQTKTKLDLRVLARFADLRELYVESHTNGIETISSLASLEQLTLRSISLPDLSLLIPLKQLKALDLKLGGTRDLSLLPQVGQLRYVELWMIKGLNDLSPISDLPRLRYLFLQSLRQVTTLPSFDRSVEFRRVHLETMKGLTGLEPLATAPALEELVVVDCPQFGPEQFAPLVGHSSLRAALVGTRSRKKNDAISALLGLPEPDRKTSWRDV